MIHNQTSEKNNQNFMQHKNQQPLKLFRAEEQKQRLLPRFCKGSFPAFSLTEINVGSDPVQMSTKAEINENIDTRHYCNNKGNTLHAVVLADNWCNRIHIKKLFQNLNQNHDRQDNLIIKNIPLGGML